VTATGDPPLTHRWWWVGYRTKSNKKRCGMSGEETALVPGQQNGLAVTKPTLSVDDLMAPSTEGYVDGDAGLGSEDVGSDVVILPRMTLLQPMSKAITESSDETPPVAGTWFLTPYARRLTLKASDPIAFVVVRVYPTQRLWTPLDEGGGLICEASAGDYQAREPNGLAGARLQVTAEGTNATAVEWEGGKPTDRCKECVYGPGAAAAAAGKPPTGKGNPWLPKYVSTGDGKTVAVPDKLRTPRCQSGLDALVLVAAPAVDGMPRELIPAFITFTRSAFPAGRSLAGMIKMASRLPAWARLFEFRVKKVTNDKGTFFVPTVRPIGATRPELAEIAKALYTETEGKDHRPSMEDAEDIGPADLAGDSADADVPGGVAIGDDDPVASDSF
jgi:hypothetical protein